MLTFTEWKTMRKALSDKVTASILARVDAYVRCHPTAKLPQSIDVTDIARSLWDARLITQATPAEVLDAAADEIRRAGWIVTFDVRTTEKVVIVIDSPDERFSPPAPVP